MAEILFELEATGGEEVSAAFDDVKASQLGAGEAAQRFSAQLRAIKAATAPAKQGLDLVSRSAQGVAIRVQAAQVPTAALGSALGQLGSQLRGISPEFDAFGDVLGSVSAGMQTAASMPGPWGVALGGLTTALGIASTAIGYMNEQTNDLTRRQREAAQATEALGLSVQEAAVARVEATIIESNARVQSLRTEGDNEAFIAESANLRALQAQREEALRPIREQQALTEQLRSEEYARNQAAAENGRLAEENAQTMAEINAVMAEITEAEQERAAAAAVARAHAAEERRELEARLSREESFFDELQRLRERDVDDEIRARHEVNVAIERAQLESLEKQKQAARELYEEQLEALEQQKQAAIEASQQVKDDAQGVLGPAINELTGALSAVIAGSESADEAFQGLLASFLEMLSQKAALEAAGQFASAIASFASQDYGGGALHLAAGVAWTAVAVASGAASIAVAPPAAATPASPQQSAPAESGGGGNVVINMNGNMVTASTHAEVGREVSHALAADTRRFGAGRR